MKLKSVKLANAIRCAQKEYSFLSSDEFDIDLEGATIKLTHKRHQSCTFTSLFNCIFWTVEDESNRDVETILARAEAKEKSKQARTT